MGLKIGWVKLNRNFLNFPFYQDTNAVRVYVHLKLCANYEAVPWQGLVLQPGQCVTTLQELSKELRISVQQVRGAIQKLKSTRMITVKTTNKFSVFSVHDSCISEGFEFKNNTQDSMQNNIKITRKEQTDNTQKTLLPIEKEKEKERKQDNQTTLLSDEADDEFIELDEAEAAIIDENCRQMLAYVGNKDVVKTLQYFDENRAKLKIADVTDFLQLCKIADTFGFLRVKRSIDAAMIIKPKPHTLNFIRQQLCGQQ